jgi:hypothetical protein
MVQINLKLGQLYGCPYVNEPADAEQRLVEAVERALGEQQRRETEGVQQGEGAWLTSTELGATLEGTLQQRSPPGRRDLAVPVCDCC